jgi:hypothetical protein
VAGHRLERADSGEFFARVRPRTYQTKRPMSFEITNNSFLKKHVLTVDSSGLRFENPILGARRFRFHQVESVLLSTDHTLSFQVGNEVFSIPVKMENSDHKNVIDFLLQEVRRTTE